MFSGQGSQSHQMGRELYENDPCFAQHMQAMDAQVQALIGQSVLATLYGTRARSEPFDDVSLTHPAIFMVEYALAQTLKARGIEPDLTLGVSLGTAAAAAVSGIWPMAQALTMVVEHAALIAAHAQAGAMLAVLAPPAMQQMAPLCDLSVVASYNGPSHMVLSMRQAHAPEVERFLQAQGIVSARLPVRYAFHSPWLLPEGMGDLASIHAPIGQAANTPLVCCADSAIHAELAPNHLSRVGRVPIQLARTLAMLEARGAHRYLDVGPSGTLATLLKYQLREGSGSTAQALMNPYGRDLALLAAVQAFGHDAH